MKIICFLALLCLSLGSCGQSPSNSKPLKVGDTIPYIILTDVINFPVSKIQLSPSTNQYTLLDFWASWCGSCIKAIPKLDSLQKQFGNNLRIIMVNPKLAGDNAAKLEKALLKVTGTKRQLFSIPVAVADSVLSSLFSFHSLPHYVWVNRQGVIVAITNSAQVNAANIKAFTRGRKINLPLKPS
jgi:thiol-disulfide isomerase/thioredoxin